MFSAEVFIKGGHLCVKLITSIVLFVVVSLIFHLEVYFKTNMIPAVLMDVKV